MLRTYQIQNQEAHSKQSGLIFIMPLFCAVGEHESISEQIFVAGSIHGVVCHCMDLDT